MTVSVDIDLLERLILTAERAADDGMIFAGAGKTIPNDDELDALRESIAAERRRLNDWGRID